MYTNHVSIQTTDAAVTVSTSRYKNVLKRRECLSFSVIAFGDYDYDGEHRQSHRHKSTSAGTSYSTRLVTSGSGSANANCAQL